MIDTSSSFEGDKSEIVAAIGLLILSVYLMYFIVSILEQFVKTTVKNMCKGIH